MRPFGLHVAIAPTKNIERYEWFLEKATEIGIEAVTPIFCQRSERRKVRLDRLERVMVAAMKQSFRGVLPRLHEPVDFASFVRRDLPEGTQKLIATCQPLPERHLLDAWTPGTDLVVLIGPEGDFSPEEQALAHAAGYEPVQLGRARLRTETAGVLTAAAVALKAQTEGDPKRSGLGKTDMEGASG
ncbi:MAG: 16S rRNA (uracil(1498)-N(3))-methyltransferase [Bacteroidetes bacterium]|nr:MAG: 16S rRNA (uracil(1498)-N(3))-methyltransferase [Bacteroidota bacterium]